MNAGALGRGHGSWDSCPYRYLLTKGLWSLHTLGGAGEGEESVVEPSNSSWERGEVSREMKQGEEMKD